MISVPETLGDAAKIAEAGDKIYHERWQQQYEPSHNGDFVAIDIATGEAFLAKEAVDALEQACAANPESFFHLIRIGSEAAFEGGFLLSQCL
jgi:hypothetical protein